MYRYECKYLYKYGPTQLDSIQPSTAEENTYGYGAKQDFTTMDELTATFEFKNNLPIFDSGRAYVTHVRKGGGKTVHDTGGFFSGTKLISFKFQAGDEIKVALALKKLASSIWRIYCYTGSFYPTKSFKTCFTMTEHTEDCRSGSPC
jgi:hypothetical protein